MEAQDKMKFTAAYEAVLEKLRIWHRLLSLLSQKLLQYILYFAAFLAGGGVERSLGVLWKERQLLALFFHVSDILECSRWIQAYQQAQPDDSWILCLEYEFCIREPEGGQTVKSNHKPQGHIILQTQVSVMEFSPLLLDHCFPESGNMSPWGWPLIFFSVVCPFILFITDYWVFDFLFSHKVSLSKVAFPDYIYSDYHDCSAIILTVWKWLL